MRAFITPLPPTNRHTPSLNPDRACVRPHTNGARSTPTCGLFDLWKTGNAPTRPKLNFSIGYTYLAHPEKNTGEDAFFVEGNTIGVFDGVSGAFDTRGVDPRLFSQTLAADTRENVRRYGSGRVVKAAIDAAAGNEQIGASTACVVGMDDYGRLFGINLGDSGVRIVREGKCVFRTREQQHFFNCPYQLGTDSEDGLAMGQNVQSKVRPGDWLIVATDGLFDNIDDKDICAICAEESEAMALAERLGDTASARGVDKSFNSPFMKNALKAGVEWQGGKADDITVVVAAITEENLEATSLLSTLPEVAEVE